MVKYFFPSNSFLNCFKPNGEMHKKSFLRQPALWQKLCHPNLVHFLGVLRVSDRLIFLIEDHRRGNFDGVLRKKGKLDHLTTVFLCFRRSVNYLHQHKLHANTPRFDPKKCITRRRRLPSSDGLGLILLSILQKKHRITQPKAGPLLYYRQ